MKTRIPKTLAAVMRHDSDQWEIGDALREECYPNGQLTYEEAAEELAHKGYGHYSGQYLGKLARTAIAFPKRSRRDHLSWAIHNEAGTPENLKAIVDGTKEEGTKLTRDIVRSVVKFQREQEEKAEDEEAAARIDPRASRGSGVPSKPVPMPVIVVSLELTGNARKATKLAQESVEAIKGRVLQLDRESIQDLREAWLEASNACREVAETVGKTTTDKRGHLREVV